MKNTMRIFAISPGWKEKGPRRSHSWPPPDSSPMTGSMGESSSKMPTIMRVYL